MFASPEQQLGSSEGRGGGRSRLTGGGEESPTKYRLPPPFRLPVARSLLPQLGVHGEFTLLQSTHHHRRSTNTNCMPYIAHNRVGHQTSAKGERFGRVSESSHVTSHSLSLSELCIMHLHQASWRWKCAADAAYDPAEQHLTRCLARVQWTTS